MPTQIEPQLEETIEVDASPARVWSLVSDVRRMARWSPQVLKTFVRGGGPVQLGTLTVNVNRRGLLVWPTQAKVVRFEPHREFALRIKDNYTVWSFTLEPTDAGGARITQRREAPQGISDISLRLTDAVLGGQQAFTAELRAGMRQTLARIKADVETR
jgi:uncharacterized protein YndB with AHSA1/START domain